MGVLVIWKGIDICVEFLRGVSTSLECVLTASVFITETKVVI